MSQTGVPGRYYYFECVFLIEKLILTGLIIFLDPGSIFQAVCGTCVAFAFFTVEVAAWPYATDQDNVLKAVRVAVLPLR